MSIAKIYAGLVELRRKISVLQKGLSHAAPVGKSVSSIEYLSAVVVVVSEVIQTIQATTAKTMRENKKDDTDIPDQSLD